MKKLLLLLTAAVVALSLTAADVSTTQAKAAADAFLKKQVAAGHLKASAASNLQLVRAEQSVAKPAAVDYYIFNSAKSYVVVAGDDLAPQILMYGEEGALDVNNIPPAMEWLLNKYKYQIDGLKAGTRAPIKLPKFATTPVAPLVTANWDQGAPYNNQCPSSGWGGRVYTGCPATSLSMCYYKWKWPETYPAVAAISGTGGVSASALSARAADWDNMIDEYTGPTNTSYTTDQANAVAWLMRYAGQAIPDYYYSTSGSGANDPEIYQGVLNMGYTDAQYLLLTEYNGYSNGSQQYTDAQWNEWMLNELHNGRPIEYLAFDSKNSDHGGHAFNVFGVNASGQYYVNWGWSGDSNGYCTLHNFTTATGSTGGAGSYIFNWGEAMIIGIEPPEGATTTPRITVDPGTLTMNTTVGTPVTATFRVTGANLTGNVNLSISGNNAFSLSTTSISANQAANGVNVTVTYNPTAVGTNEATVTLTSTGAEAVTVKLNGTANPKPLETYAPVMQEASNITNTSFTATWTDQTPAANVASYTLYVSAKAEVAQLETVDWTSSATVPTGWTSSGLKYWSSTSSCYLTSDGYVKSKTYDLTGYNKVTVRVYSEYYDNNNAANSITVATSKDSKTLSVTSTSYTWHTFVLDCASSDYIYLTSSGMPDLQYVEVYAGDLTATQLKASETGDATYRIITGITSKSYTVTGLTEGGTFNFYVVANYTNSAIGTSNTEQVTLLENTNPVIAVNPISLDMTANAGETATATFNVSGANLTGNVNLALTDANGVYSITPTTISAANAMNGVDVTVTYAPTAHGNHNATITLSSAGAENVAATLNGTATLAKYTPVMLPAVEEYINFNKFRADWTDPTPEANVESYTLEVSAKPTQPVIPVERIGYIDGTTYTNQNYQAVTLTTPWSGENVYGGYGAIYFRNASHQNATTDGYIKYTIPAEYQNMPFTVKITTANTDYGSGRFVVGSTQTASVTYSMSTGETHSWLVTGSAGDVITITSPEDQYSPDIATIEIYTGDATVATLRANESGDQNYRLITGITDKFYTVNNLAEYGTFLYKVKAIYIDGTESDWSNEQEVTLFENGHGFELGDVNHDNYVNITDVTALINYVSTGNGNICMICADYNVDGYVNISDVIALIGRIQNSAKLNIEMPQTGR
jgi:hypothetical protein